MSDQDKNQKPQGNTTIVNDDKSVESPLDPNDNFRDVINDTSGLTGISSDYNGPTAPPQDTGSVSRTMSDAKYASSTGQDESNDVNSPTRANPTKQEEVNGLNNPTPGEVGESSVSGDMPDPDSDDDTLENAHSAGLRLNEDEEHPQELDIASDIDKAEEYQRTH